uniref:Ribonuclease H-like domain-containing protein n=1 Tax=Tanacetum cinerariifolium TaxID=118510 RepID=A0A6L2NKX3_TANCI|nr:ribonuclease H-like domain-containing protein [Tanacetum cinerariifolium]
MRASKSILKVCTSRILVDARLKFQPKTEKASLVKEGFDRETLCFQLSPKVIEIIVNGNWAWLEHWYSKFLDLAILNVPILYPNLVVGIIWIDNDNNESGLSDFSGNQLFSAADLGNSLARLKVANYDKMLKLIQFLMGLDDIYQPIKSSILTREVLLEAKDAFLIISREESYRGIPSSSGTAKTQKAQASAFVSKQSDMNRSRNNNWSNNRNNVNRGVYDNLLCKNCGLKCHTIDRCFEIIGYPSGFKRNLNLKPNTNGDSKSNSGDFRKGSSNNSKTKTSGNVSFTNEQVMKLLSLLNDKGFAGQSNMAWFEKGRVLGTGNEFGDLYLFDKAYNKSTMANNSSLNLPNLDHEGPCENATDSEVTNFNFFDCVESDPKPKASISPNDDEEGSSCRDGSVHQSRPSHSLDQPKVGVDEQIPTLGSGSDLPIKYKSNGEVDRFKARFVAKGFRQKEGLDYEETFSHVVKMGTVRCLLSLVAQNEWDIYQIDINNDFLYGDLIEEVYMLPPPGTSKVEIAKFKHFLSNRFKIKDLGELKYFLGIEVFKVSDGLCLSQRKYCLELLQDFRISDFSGNQSLFAADLGNSIARLEVANYDKMLKLIQFLMGLDDIYQPIRSSILTREVLLEAKDAFLIISREESYRGIYFSSGTAKTQKAQAPAFVSKQSDMNRNRNNNWSNNRNNVNRGVYDNLLWFEKGRVLGTGSEFGGLYLFDKAYNKSTMANNIKFVSCFVYKEVWHCRLGHHANQVLKVLKGSLNLANLDHEGPCEVCHKAKQTRDSLPLSENELIIFGQLMHLDVWGPYKVISREGFRYFLTIVDDYSMSVWMYLIRSKDELFESDPISKASISPNDDEEGSSCRDGSVHQLRPSHSLDQPKVDEQIPTLGTSKVEIAKFKHFLSNRFKINDSGELIYFLGIEVFRVSGGLCLSQRIKKQVTLSKSLAEAKYKSMAVATCEIMWIVKIMSNLNIKNLLPAELYCDNMAAMQIAANPVMHEKTKHFDLDVHFIRENVYSWF